MNLAELPPRVRETIRVANIAARGLLRSRLPQMAAALAYRTIFGLAPVTVVSLSIIGAFATEAQLTTMVERAMEYTGLAEAEFQHDADPLDPADADQQSGAEQPPPAPPREPPPATGPAGARPVPGQIDEWIETLVDNVSGLKFGAIGAVGVVILIYAAIGMVVEVERAFNHVYRAPRGRSWARRITQYWTTLTLGALLLVATFYVGGRTKTWLTGLVEADQLTVLQSLWVGSVGFGVTVAISTLMLLLIYTTVPNSRVQVRSALAGAFVAAILWEAGKWGFTQYITHSAGLTRVYGSLAVVPLFLLWIYLTWLIVLFGLQVAYGLQNIGLISEGGDDEEEGPTFIEPATLITLAGQLAGSFGEGQTLASEAAAQRLGLSESQAQRLLERLAAAGVARQAASDTRWTLARPAERISLIEIFDAGLKALRTGDVSDDGPGSGALQALREAQRARLEGRTLASIVAPSSDRPDPANPPSKADSA